MEKYKVEVAASAEKTLWKLPKAMISRVTQSLQALSLNPRPAGCRKLSGEENTYRIRIGVYRVIYEIHDQLILIKVLKIGHRKDIYR